MGVNQAYCGDCSAIHTNIKSLCCTPEVNLQSYCIPTIIYNVVCQLYIYVCTKILFLKKTWQEAEPAFLLIRPGLVLHWKWGCVSFRASERLLTPPFALLAVCTSRPEAATMGRSWSAALGGESHMQRKRGSQPEQQQLSDMGMTPAQPSSPASPPLSTTWASPANPEHHERTRYCLSNEILKLRGNRQMSITRY